MLTSFPEHVLFLSECVEGGRKTFRADALGGRESPTRGQPKPATTRDPAYLAAGRAAANGLRERVASLNMGRKIEM